MSEAARLVTAEELEKFPDDDRRYELVEGRVICMTPVGFQHGRIVMHFGSILHQHVQSRKLGVVMTEVGFKLASNPDTVRAPDLAFIRQDRIPISAPRGFWNGPADLAVEVLSPDDRQSDVRTKVEQYLTRGVPLVVVIDPDAETAATCRRSAASAVLHGVERLDLDDVVPGLSCRVEEIFL
jgi:Uma2 family endonuclease